MTIIPQQSDIQSITTVESINHRKEKSQYGKNVAKLSITGSKIIARNCYICNKMGRLCYISRCYRDYRSAGNKAKIDNEQSLKEMGAINLGLSQRIGGGKIATFIAGVCGVARYALKVRKGDVVVLEPENGSREVRATTSDSDSLVRSAIAPSRRWRLSRCRHD